MTWLPVLFDGFLGALVGSAGSFVAAVWVVRRQSRLDRELAVKQRRTDAAATLMPVLYSAMDRLIVSVDIIDPAKLRERYYKVGRSLTRSLALAARVTPGASMELVKVADLLIFEAPPSDLDGASALEWVRQKGEVALDALTNYSRTMELLLDMTIDSERTGKDIFPEVTP